LFKSLCHPLHQEFSDHVLFPSNYEDFIRGTVWSVIPQILRRLQVRIAPANGFGNGRSPSSRAKGDHTLRLVAAATLHMPRRRVRISGRENGGLPRMMQCGSTQQR
jgi:hypothetical protein